MFPAEAEMQRHALLLVSKCKDLQYCLQLRQYANIEALLSI